jgi:Tc toxin complex TcA C-terminal TcB-binding domain/Neuraminidase-like domain/Salmonella virulence plasmid 28.1kDa A protein
MELTVAGDLKRGMTGNAVGDLQTALLQLGYRITDTELINKFFGETTHDAVVGYQKNLKLVPNGIFEGKAAWLMDENHEHPNKFIVLGQVLDAATGKAFEETLTIRVFDKDLRSEELIKEEKTNTDGEYSVFYKADDFRNDEKNRADLFVRVLNKAGTTVLATSPIIFNARKFEVVNFIIGEARGLSEFGRIVAELTTLLRGIAQKDLTGQDISFLAGETGIDAAWLTLLAESARRNAQAGAIPQSAFYGLFRQGLPTDLKELLKNEISLLRAALESASNEAIIPQLSSAQLDQIANELRILKASLLLQPAAGDTPSLGDLLGTAKNLPAEKRPIVAGLLVLHGGTTRGFWDAIAASDLLPIEKNDVRFTLQTGDLTTNHLPLVTALRNGYDFNQNGAPPTANPGTIGLRPFAVKGVGEWKQLLQTTGAPPSTPGATPQEKIDNYAAALNAYMENALPTPVIAGRFVADVAGDSPFNPVRADLQTFFNNPVNKFYEFREVPIDVYLSTNRETKLGGVNNPTALLAELKNMQRLFNMTPRYAQIRSFRKDDVHSAFSMVQVGERRFVESYASVLGGEAAAIETYRRAKQTHAAALNFYLGQAVAANAASPLVIPNGSVKQQSIGKLAAAPASASPDLPTLFGSLDLCDCEQCQSVYSPAAYFVDILKFLGDGPKKQNLTPLQVLFARRPDLEHIELTCENTTTQLPYIDLTREIMEAAVAKREFNIGDSNASSIIADLNAEKMPGTFPAVFASKGYTTTAKASVRKDELQPPSWFILDTGWSFTLKYLGSGNGFEVKAWPQTSWTSDELRANPEHVNNPAYDELRNAVYSWHLPLIFPVEEIRGYLAHFGVKRADVMETFFHDPSSDVLTDQGLANEYIGVTTEEAKIITGFTTGGPNTPSGPWDFWGLPQTVSGLKDPTDGSAPDAAGDWDEVLQRVSIFLQQSGLVYREMLELLGFYFINPATASGRRFGIVSTDLANPATCNLSRLKIEVTDSAITDKKAALKEAWNKIHRFVRLSRKLGWTMRDLDKAIVALQPKNGANLDITAGFLVEVSRIQRLSAQFGLPVVNLLSFWKTMDSGRYLDHFVEGEPAVPSLYATLFNNRAAAGQSLPEDPATLNGKLSENKSRVGAALQISIDDLSLMLADNNVVTGDLLSLENLSKLYGHATFARALNYSIRTYLAALKLISKTPLASTEDTIKFIQESERIAASGFSIEDLNYLLRHDFAANSPIAISDPAIAAVLGSIRDEVRKVAAENGNAATDEPNDDLTNRKHAIVIQHVGDYLSFASSSARELLTNWVNSTANPTQKAIDVFLADSFAESDPDVEVSRAAFPDQFDTFVRLYKIATLNHDFQLTPPQLQWLFDFGPDNGWLDLNKFPFDEVEPDPPLYPRWARLADLFQLSAALPLAEGVLTDVFTSAHGGSSITALLGKISEGLSWKLENLTALNSGFSFGVANYKDEQALRRLHAAFTMLEQLGASADQCLSWTKPGMNKTDEQKCAADVKALVRARLDNEQWLEKARSLNDPLREKQRAGLVSYLVLRRNARNGDELYDDFLVDVEMSPCMMTTRIKQAIGSVQLFIQRSLMNLEGQVSLTPKEAREWAQWRKQYRIWEANRKILLYPENWIEPELRDDKSVFFKDLENELLQSEVTMDTAETAFVHYLEKLHDVARLEIVGMYQQQEAADGKIEVDDLHVIARSFSSPHVYYYRRQINAANWTPWEKVEADIQGNHVIPVVWNRRLYVFWPIFTVKQKEKPLTMPTDGTPIEGGEKVLEVQLAWSEYKKGKWSPKKLASPFLSTLTHPESELTDAQFKLFSFKSRIATTLTRGEQLFIDCYGPVELIKTVTITSADRKAIKETALFSLGPGNSKSVNAKVDGGLFSSSDVTKAEIRKKDSGGNLVEAIKLNDDGTVDIKNTSTTATFKYWLASADYRPESIRNIGQRQECFIDDGFHSPNLIGKNGDSAKALVGVETALALVPLGIGDPPGQIDIADNQVCVIIAEAYCSFNLVTIPTTSTTVTTTTKTTDPAQAIVTFYFDDGQQSVSVLTESNASSQIEPIPGTIFENMMMVESQNPNNDGLLDTRILQRTRWPFRLLPLHQSYQAKTLEYPAFFQDDVRGYFVTKNEGTNRIQFSTFYHPLVSGFVRSLNHSGVGGLLTLANQRLTDSSSAFDNYLPDSAQVDTNAKPREDVDFTYGGAYSLYNWELFFHTPFMIATQLSKNQRFEEAQKWFHYIFDPTATDSPDNANTPGPERFWRVKPFYTQAKDGTQTLEELFDNANALNAQIHEWEVNPFRPHVIARLRLVTYMKAVVMRYIDNLVAWGDQLFRRDTIESINEATQLYILAAQILGSRPEQIPARAKAKVQTYRSLDDAESLNGLANASVEIEGFLSPSVVPPADETKPNGMPLMPFFGIPKNEKLLSYWNTVADRLFKIRHCQNIEGVVRSLPTFDSPIDPGLLTRAAGIGVDIASALSDINVTLPHYRFNIMLQKATELCGEVKSLGGALLSALEKRDAEALALLRSTHEIKVLKAVRTVKERQLAEAKESRTGLDRNKEMITLRRDYYRDIAFVNPWEGTQLALTGATLGLQTYEAAMLTLGGALSLIPNFKLALPFSTGFTSGGDNLERSVSSFSNSIGKVVGILNTSASMAGTMGGHQRRFDDWKLQERLANKELEQIEKQIAAADIRVAIAGKELSNHDLQVQNNAEADEFMRSKFTNRELYDWMVGQISGIYFQSYQLAYDVAKRAESAYRYELAVRESSFIQFGYWDSLKKGLLAGERLSYDLKRMEAAYLDQNKREYEIVKHVSLLSIDPVSLVKLKQTGECFVTLPETLFDIDYTGHYMRRIKSVGITIPCVAGPYSGVNCTLTLQSSSIRHSNALLDDKYGRQTTDARFADSVGTVQTIVTSGAQHDSGMFETNLHDERYLPFEGQGAISKWHIEMPKNFKSFDYNTISDVVLHVRYTSRDGGAQLKTQADQELQTALNDFIRVEGAHGLTQMFSLRHEFSTEWSRFLNAPAGSTSSLKMAITKERFPFLFQGKNISIKTIEVYVKVATSPESIKIALAADPAAPETVSLSLWNGLMRGAREINNGPGAFTLNAWRNGNDPLEPNAIQDIIIVCRYTVS